MTVHTHPGARVMKKTGKFETPNTPNKGRIAVILIVIACVLAISVVAGFLFLRAGSDDSQATTAPTETQAPETTEPTQGPTEAIPVETVDPTLHWKTGFVAAVGTFADYYDAYGTPAGRVLRGAELKYEVGPDGKTWIVANETVGYLEDGAGIVTDIAESVRAQTL